MEGEQKIFGATVLGWTGKQRQAEKKSSI